MSRAGRIRVETSCDVRFVGVKVMEGAYRNGRLNSLQEKRRQDPGNKGLWTLKYADLEANVKGPVHDITKVSLEPLPQQRPPLFALLLIPHATETLTQNRDL